MKRDERFFTFVIAWILSLKERNHAQLYVEILDYLYHIKRFHRPS